MWRRRSILAGRASSLSRPAAGPKLSSSDLHNHSQQVLFIINHHQILLSQSPSHFSTYLLHFPNTTSTSSIYQNPRFFSTNNDVVHQPQPQTQPQPQPHIEISTISENHSFNNTVIDDDFSSISSEFDESTTTTATTTSSDAASFIFDDETSDTQIVTTAEDEIFEIDSDQLESVLSLLQSSPSLDDGSLESTLDNMVGFGLTLHEQFLVRVLETPLVPGNNLIQFSKWCWTKPQISVTSRAVAALAHSICSGLRKKEAYALWDLVKEIGEKENGVLNTHILNELISLFSRLGKGKAGFEVFNKFGEFGCVPDAETYYFTIEALCRRSIYDWACSVTEKMIDTGNLPDNEKIGAIISYLCKGSKTKDAHLVYLSAKEKDRHPPRNSVNFLISSLCREDETVRIALEMLDDYSDHERKRAINPFSSVIRGLCRIKDVEGAKELLFKMIDAGPSPGNAVFNSIVNGFSKAGDMEEAKKVMKMMEKRGLKPDVYTYSVIMSGYARGGEMEAACEVLAEAKKKHSKLSPVTYHTLIRGYCKLEEFDKALKLLSEMKEFGVEPTADEYNKLIQSLCIKALDWETAEKLLEEMKGNGLNLNGITKGLIKAVKEMEEEEGKSGEAIVEAELITSAN